MVEIALNGREIIRNIEDDILSFKIIYKIKNTTN